MIDPQPVDLPPDEQARLDALSAEWDRLAEEYDGTDDLPEDAAVRLDALNAEIERLSTQQQVYDPDVIGRGGAFIALNHDGTARIEPGFIRPEDQPQRAATKSPIAEVGDEAVSEVEETPDRDGDGEDDMGSLSDSLVRDLTAHRTLGLRLAVGENPDVALLAVTHALAAQTFYNGYDEGTCLDIRPRSSPLGGDAVGIEDTEAARKLAERHDGWAAQMPTDLAGLWGFIADFDQDSRMALFAHCAALTVYAVRVPWNRKPRTWATGDALAQALDLDMSAHWSPTARSYFERVTKAGILLAVQDAISVDAAERMSGMKKQAMAQAAEQLLAGSEWLPALLRTGDVDRCESVGAAEGEPLAEAAA